MYFFDDFERADGSPVGNGWYQESPTNPRIVGGAVVTTAASIFRRMSRTVSPEFSAGDYIAVSFSAKVAVASSGYLQLRFDAGATTRRVQLSRTGASLLDIGGNNSNINLSQEEWRTFYATVDGTSLVFSDGLNSFTVADIGIAAEDIDHIYLEFGGIGAEVDWFGYDERPVPPTGFTAKFDSNGGTAAADQTVSPVTFPSVTKPCCTLLGWATEPDGAVVYEAGDTLAIGDVGEVWFYAVWQQNEPVPLPSLPYRGWFGTMEQLFTAGWFDETVRAVRGRAVLTLETAGQVRYTAPKKGIGWFLRPETEGTWTREEAEEGAWTTTTTVEGEWTATEAEDTDPVTNPYEGSE